MGARVAIVLAALLLPVAASAQSALLAAGVGAEVAREVSGVGYRSPGNGESLAWWLRAGSGITDRFGVELEFARPSGIERDETPDLRLLAQEGPAGSLVYNLRGDPTFSSMLSSSMLSLPSITYRVRSEQRNTTLTAAAWVRQDVADRVSLVYLGGLAFARIERRFSYDVGTVLPRLALLPPATSSENVEYSTGPMVGMDIRIGLTEHVQVIPGIRLLGIANGWNVRPGVSLGWTF